MDGEDRFQFYVSDGLRKLLVSKDLYETEEEAKEVGSELFLLGTFEQSYKTQDNQKAAKYTFDVVFNPLDYANYLHAILKVRNSISSAGIKCSAICWPVFQSSFTDYVLLMFALNGQRNDPAKIIEDKARFLSNYPAISRKRGQAANYTDQQNVWNTPNVSGLERRVTSLMGIRDWQRQNLGNFEVVKRTDRYRLILKDHRGCKVFVSEMAYPTIEAAAAAWGELINLAKDKANYRCFDCPTDSVYGFELLDGDECLLANHPVFYPTSEKRDAVKDCIVQWTNGDGLPSGIGTSNEGYYFSLNDQDGNLLFENSEPFMTGGGSLGGMVHFH